MARKRPEGAGKVKMDMTPMIDIVFQLITFFVFTLKVIEPEGDFNINMPAGGAGASTETVMPDIKVKLRANPDGTLGALFLGQRNLGNSDDSFKQLNIEILKLIGTPGNELAKDMQVEIDADYTLHFRYVISAVGACSGRLDKRSNKVVKYIEKIKFTPPKPPAAAS